MGEADRTSDGLDKEMFQRWVLANQYEMMASLEPELGDDHRDLADRIRSWWPFESLDPVDRMREAREDPLTAEDQGFVMDVLELFDALQRADGEGKVEGDDRTAVAFPGFCGNYESKYLSYLKWLRDHQRFNYVRLGDPRDPNSHMPTVAAYERMLAKWNALGRPRTLSAAEASAIIAELRLVRLTLNSESKWVDIGPPASAPDSPASGDARRESEKAV